MGFGVNYSNAKFRAKCRVLNPRLRFSFGPDVASGVYLMAPEEFGRGFRHLVSYASPRFYPSIPQQDFRDDQKINHEGMATYVRGWQTVVNTLIGKGAFTRGAAKRVFSSLRKDRRGDKD